MNKFIIKARRLACLVFFPLAATAQIPSVTIDSCYAWAKQNYPLIKQYDLITKSEKYQLQNLVKGYLPQINIAGQATYQSAVTRLPIKLPGDNIPQLSKDQYKLYAELTQPVYDGGMIKAKKELQQAQAAAERQHIAVQLYQVNERINHLFFGLLLVNEQLKQHDILEHDIQLGIDNITAAVAHGTALQSSLDVLKAEKLKAGQQTILLEANRRAYLEMLSMFVHHPLDEHTVFVRPTALNTSPEISRPELAGFDYQNKILDIRGNLLSAGTRPRLYLFAQGGAGRPALNFLSNDFKGYYLGGLRLSFPLTGFYTMNNKKALIQIERQQLTVERETFLFNTKLTLKAQAEGITKLKKLIASDDEIISLRQNIKKAALAQLQHGVINANDYMREVLAENNARQNKIIHETQLLTTEYSAQNTAGHQ